MNVLLIEPKKKDAQRLKEIISDRNWAVDQCENGLQAINKIRHFGYDIIFTEIYLPIIDGMSVCALAKQKKPDTKVVVTTTETHYAKKIQAFHSGVDEYILKPVRRAALEEKIKRFSFGSLMIENPKRLRAGDLVMNLGTREVHRFGEKVHLRRREFNLLMFMMMNSRKILNRNTILEHVWESPVGSVSTNLIDVYMNNLRKKIDGSREEKLIQTIHGVGYKFGMESQPA